MTVYLTIQEVLALHEVLINRYGGAKGLRDPGALEAALFRPQTGYYVDEIEQAAALVESLAINHPFIDGNKRIAYAVMDVFLRLNGYRIVTTYKEIYPWIMKRFETGTYDFDHWAKWLRAHVQIKVINN